MEDWCVFEVKRQGGGHNDGDAGYRLECAEMSTAFRKDLLAALDGLADLNNVESRGKRLLELLSLLLVVDREGVEEARASDLELGDLLAVGTGGALDAGGRSVLSASNLEEFLDVGNLLRLLDCE